MAPYFVADAMTKIAPHHSSIETLWKMKWQKPCSMGIYPFDDGKLEDFEKVFAKLIEMNLHEPYDYDVYARPFFPVAEELEAQAKTAEGAGDHAQASAFYLRAAAVYRIARFPLPSSPQQKLAWQRGKAAYLKGSQYLDPPNREILIPHTHASPSDLGPTIPIYVRLPPTASASSPAPVLLFICGLDAYRTDHTMRTTKHVQNGWACISVDIPGTGDSPAAPNDPLSPDRQWSSVLDWIASQDYLDKSRVVARGVSTGGYYAMRIAHTHAEHLYGVVAQGGGCHGMFDPVWIEAQDGMEYPFGLAEALAEKFGYGSVEEMKKDAQKRFSLLYNGVLDKPSARLLLINGMNDEIFPIEDSMLLLQHGSVKDARFVSNTFHMGNPPAEPIIYDWIQKLL